MRTSTAALNKFSVPLFLTGARRGIPIVLGYLPLSFAFGVLAGEAGLSVLETGLMSILVFAGSSQFIAVNMIMAGAPALSIILTTFVVNARHMLMSAAMAPFVRGWSRTRQILFGSSLPDEPFVLNITWFSKYEVNYESAIGVNCASYLGWVVPSFAGAITGRLLGDLSPLGLDFALAGVFIALLVPYFKERRELITALIAATVSVVLCLAEVGRWNVILATLAAATIGLVLPVSGSAKSAAVVEETTLKPGGGSAAVSEAETEAAAINAAERCEGPEGPDGVDARNISAGASDGERDGGAQ